jgi:hypothetical protein
LRADLCFSLAFCLLAACSGSGREYVGNDAGNRDGDTPTGPEITLTFDFDGSMNGFFFGQTDFTESTRGEITAVVEALPAPLTGSGLRVTARNNSDDQWAYIARALTSADGIVPSQRYTARIHARIASQAASGCFGVGGSFEAVAIKGGVVVTMPTGVLDGQGYTSFSADKGSQSEIGPEATSLGNIANGRACEEASAWVRLDRMGSMNISSNAAGTLYLYVGTDSGFEAEHTLVYDSIVLTLTPIDG